MSRRLRVLIAGMVAGQDAAKKLRPGPLRLQPAALQPGYGHRKFPLPDGCPAFGWQIWKQLSDKFTYLPVAHRTL